jgi:hypothetical protein
MIVMDVYDFIVLRQSNIELDEHCIDTLIAAINHFSLDSSCPIYPPYHRKYGIFECNQMRPYGITGIELHKYCICFKKEVWEKILTLDVRFIESKIKELNLKHGMVCNALIYAR